MKKTWSEANVEVLDVKETAFGPYNPNTPDSEKTEVKDPATDVLLGWEQLFGEGTASTAR